MCVQYIVKYACVCRHTFNICVYVYIYVHMHNNSPPDLPFQDVHANEQEPHSFRLDNLNVEDIFSVPLQMI